MSIPIDPSASRTPIWLLVAGLLPPALLVAMPFVAEFPKAGVVFLLTIAFAILLAIAVAILRRTSPWRTDHGPAVLIVAFLWIIGTLPSGADLSLVLTTPFFIVGQTIVLGIGTWATIRRDPTRALTYAHLGGTAAILGSAIGCGLLTLGFVFID